MTESLDLPDARGPTGSPSPLPEHSQDHSSSRSGEPRSAWVTLSNTETRRLAEPRQRLQARLLDMVAMIAPAFVATVIASYTAWNLFTPSEWPLRGHTRDVPGDFAGAWLLPFVPYLPILLYEIVVTARRGQTWGKKENHIKVVRLNDGLVPTATASLVRWGLPAATGVAGFVCGFLAVTAGPDNKPTTTEWIACLCCGAASWLLVYLSALWDNNRRGWHDKAAGTVVVQEPEPQTRPDQPKRTAGDPGSGDSQQGS